jgi:carboxylesterase type B
LNSENKYSLDFTMHLGSSRAAALVGLLVNSIVIAEPTVKVGNGQITYQGTTKDAVEHFQNIKYGHDTSGDRRFAPPEPYVPLVGSVIDATTPGAACPQSRAAIPPFFDETAEISEDCLTIRISRPAGTTADDNLPVVVWLHGGAVIKGSAYDSHFEPVKLLTLSASINKPVIYVAVNYRLTIFGFARL